MKRFTLTGILRWMLIPALAVAYIGVVSCTSLTGGSPVRLPAGMAGATYEGNETCEACHESEAGAYHKDAHSKMLVSVTDAEGRAIAAPGCEACHGPGSIHVEKEGAKGTIIRESADRCFACHPDVLAKFKLQHHHPVVEGRMICSDCHGSHGESTRDKVVSAIRRSDEKCFKCHKEQKGPFVFEHEALREGCQVCHNPHGSVQDKMLVAGQSTTCLRCHFDINTNPSGNLSGGVAHGSTASTTGAKGANYDIGRGEECIDHHRAPHGSRIWRTLNR